MISKMLIYLAVLVTLVNADSDKHAKILSDNRAFDSHSGSFKYSFISSNGIKAEESGVGGKFIKGESSYHTPEGKQITISYVADEHGFQVEGDHLPTPVPLPPEYYAKLYENENYHSLHSAPHSDSSYHF